MGERDVPFEAKVQPYGDRDYTQADADSFVGKPFSVTLDEPYVDRLHSGDVPVESAEVSPDGRWLVLRGHVPHPSRWELQP